MLFCLAFVIDYFFEIAIVGDCPHLMFLMQHALPLGSVS